LEIVVVYQSRLFYKVGLAIANVAIYWLHFFCLACSRNYIPSYSCCCRQKFFMRFNFFFTSE